MPDIRHGGINAGRDMHVGGDIDASINMNEAARPISGDLRRCIEELLDALAAAGLASGPPIGQAALDLQAEIKGGTVRPSRIEQLLSLIERNAAQIATIAAAVTATRVALDH